MACAREGCRSALLDVRGPNADALDQLDWTAVAATDFRPAEVKERKQAEFLIHGRLPFTLVGRIGVPSPAVQARAAAALTGTAHRPPIEVLRPWYF